MSASSRAALSSSSKPMAIQATGSGLRTDTATSWKMRPLSTIKLVALSSVVLPRCTDDRGNGVPAFTCRPEAAMTSPLSEVSTTMAAPMRCPLFSRTETSVSVSRRRDGFAESVVGCDRLRRLGQLAAIAFQ